MRRRARFRCAVSGVLAGAVMIGAAMVRVLGVIDAPLPAAAAIFLMSLVAAALVSWGLRRDLRWAAKAVVAIGAFLALFFGMYSLLEGATGSKGTSMQSRR
jgi:hypothetical protein